MAEYYGLTIQLISKFLDVVPPLIHQSRDRSPVCDILTVANKCVQLWSDGIYEKFRADHTRPPNDTFDFFRVRDIIKQKEIQDVTRQCQTILEGSKKKLERRRWFGLRRGFDTKNLLEIVEQIEEFFAKTSGSDVTIYDDIVKEKASRDQVYSFLYELTREVEKIRDDVNVLTIRCKADLHCRRLYESDFLYNRNLVEDGSA